MGTREVLLCVTALLAGVLSLWAWATGKPGENANKRPPRHSAGEEVTQRLHPKPRPEDSWPRKEDMPWNQ